MITELDLVPASQMQIPNEYRLYYLSADGNSILKSDLQNSNIEKIQDINAHNKDDRLFVKSPDQNTYDLYTHLQGKQFDQKKEKLILKDFAELAVIDPNISGTHYPKDSFATWENYGPVSTFVSDSNWQFLTGQWAVEGIYCENKETDSQFRYAVELPFAYWQVRNAVHLKNDLVLFQLGKNQICIMNPNTPKIALVTKGKGPIVAVPKSSDEISRDPLTFSK